MAGSEMLTVEPVPAASVILLRDPLLQVLMIQRHENSSFVPGAWVFPGGAVDAADGDPGTIEAAKAAAIREVFEETGIRLTGELVPASRWITPAGLPKRYDTWFFLARVPNDVAITLQKSEAVDHTWIAPKEALAQGRSFPMVFPTIKNLEAIASANSIDELLASRRGMDIPIMRPVMIDKRIELP